MSVLFMYCHGNNEVIQKIYYKNKCVTVVGVPRPTSPLQPCRAFQQQNLSALPLKTLPGRHMEKCPHPSLMRMPYLLIKAQSAEP